MKKVVPFVGGGQSMKATGRRPQLVPGSKVFVSKADTAKRKVIFPSDYSFDIAEKGMGVLPL